MVFTRFLTVSFLFLNSQLLGFNQSPEIGIGLFLNKSQYKYYNNCKGPYLELGFNISKHVQLCFNFNYLNGNKYTTFNDQIILFKQPFTPGQNDTVRNVLTQFRYNSTSLMMKVKLTINPENKLRLFLIPSIGLSNVKEIITYNTPKLKNSTYSDLYHTIGIALGTGIYIDKDKKIMLNAEVGTGCIYSENFFTDSYIPSYNEQNLTYSRLSFGINYRFINE